jgi:predicted DCC family thiol-disulfide oxidoreductase YuxK
VVAPPIPAPPIPPDAVLILYDGVCGLCNGLVRFMLRRDRGDRCRFASLQSPVGRELVTARGGDPDELSTLWVIERPGRTDERVWRGGRAAVVALASLGRAWVLLHALRVLPAALLDRAYRALASRRYRLGGRLEACPLPAPEHRHKFVG